MAFANGAIGFGVDHAVGGAQSALNQALQPGGQEGDDSANVDWDTMNGYASGAEGYVPPGGTHIRWR
jgi:hypothetical protein